MYDLTGRDFFHFIDKYYTNQLSNSHMTWDFQEDTHVQDGKWQVNFFKIYLFFFQNSLKFFKNSLFSPKFIKIHQKFFIFIIIPSKFLNFL